MATHRRAPRPYRGGKRGRVTDLAVQPHAEHPAPAPGTDPDEGPGRHRLSDNPYLPVIDLAFDPHEPRDEHGRWTINPANIVRRFHEATPGEHAAGADWYPAAHRTAVALSKRYNIPVTEAAGLLATYSPQTPWGRNQVEAAETLREGHGFGGPGAHMYFTHDDPRVEDRVGVMATASTKTLATKVLAGEDFDTAVAGPLTKHGTHAPKGLKIRNFYHLIAEGEQADPNNPYVVIDRHAMSVAYGRRVTEEDYARMRPGSNAKYAPFLQAYRDAAAELTRTEGRTVTPEEVQATTWLVQQRHNAAESTRVGKTRAKLGEKDWAEWMAYAQRYLGLDPSTAAQTGYTELAKYIGAPLDLAFDPHEPRDSKGRWTDRLGVPSHAAFPNLAKAAGLKAPEGGYITEEKPNPPSLNKYTAIEAMTEGPHAAVGENVSANLQRKAQIKAEDWHDGGATFATGVNPQDEVVAQMLWAAYQNPGTYGLINNALRGVTPDAVIDTGYEQKHITRDKLADAARLMFQRAGTLTTADMTTYRALRSKDRDWAKILTPGSTFQEDGIVSTTVFRRMAQGWLGLKGDADREEHVGGIGPDAVVLEIHVPKGSQIVGGTTQFIETMLPPGTKFKIRSAQRTRTPNAINPIGGNAKIPPFVYTHVVADAILPDGYKATDFKPVAKHRADPTARSASLPRVQTAKRIAARLKQPDRSAPKPTKPLHQSHGASLFPTGVFDKAGPGTLFSDDETAKVWVKQSDGTWVVLGHPEQRVPSDEMALKMGHFLISPTS